MGSRDIYKSTNNWSNWEKVYENNPDSIGYGFSGNDICFLDENIGWAVGNYWVNDTSGAGILGTLDGGENWNLILKYPNSNDFWYNLYSLSSVDTACWAVGENGLILRYTQKSTLLR